jgi:hypothetical protein
MQFNSDNYIFRTTALGQALVNAGIAKEPQLVRDHKREGLLRQKQDRTNSLPSVKIELNPRLEKAA